MNSIDIFNKIRAWEYDAGESFIDYWGSNLVVPNFMCWCVGKGVLTQPQFNAWERDYISNDLYINLQASDPNYFIDGEGDLPYCIGNMDNESFYGTIVLSQFIADSMIYQEKLQKFIDGDEDEDN